MKARLILSDGTVYHGQSFGAEVNQSGEVVFTTGMVGYPESLTDPSYRGQILTYTYPLIGNYGVPARELESVMVQTRGVIVQHYEPNWSHWDGEQSLGDWLQSYGVPAITGIDTRALTKRLREQGVMLGQIVIGDSKAQSNYADPNTTNLVAEVSCKTPEWLGSGNKKVLLIDCGTKLSIVRNLTQRGIRVKRVPWDYNFIPELTQFNGILISNGPGDPTQCVPTINHLRAALRTHTPQFGICLGSQIQALAAGAQTYKLPYGHRAQNQPCVLEGTQRCILTSQNHGFAVVEKSLPKSWRVLYRNANDGSIEGLRHRTKPWFSVQFHPEASPGPMDANILFDEFIDLL